MAIGETVLGDAKIRVRIETADVERQVGRLSKKTEGLGAAVRKAKRKRKKKKKKKKEKDSLIKSARKAARAKVVGSIRGLTSTVLPVVGVAAGAAGIFKVVELIIPLVTEEVAKLIPGLTTELINKSVKDLSDQITRVEKQLISYAAAFGKTKDYSLARLRLGDEFDWSQATNIFSAIQKVEADRSTLNGIVEKNNSFRDWQLSMKSIWKSALQ